jgi:hypothetical protein
MSRALMNPNPCIIASYVQHDAPNVAPVRARVRLHMTTLAEDRQLRHDPSVPEVTTNGCRWCRAAAETIEHVLLECPRHAVARTACRASLAALDIAMDLSALAGLPLIRPATDHDRDMCNIMKRPRPLHARISRDERDRRVRSLAITADFLNTMRTIAFAGIT